MGNKFIQIEWFLAIIGICWVFYFLTVWYVEKQVPKTLRKEHKEKILELEEKLKIETDESKIKLLEENIYDLELEFSQSSEKIHKTVQRILLFPTIFVILVIVECVRQITKKIEEIIT